jgi:hypothetical protein
MAWARCCSGWTGGTASSTSRSMFPMASPSRLSPSIPATDPSPLGLNSLYLLAAQNPKPPHDRDILERPVTKNFFVCANYFVIFNCQVTPRQADRVWCAGPSACGI